MIVAITLVILLTIALAAVVAWKHRQWRKERRTARRQRTSRRAIHGNEGAVRGSRRGDRSSSSDSHEDVEMGRRRRSSSTRSRRGGDSRRSSRHERRSSQPSRHVRDEEARYQMSGGLGQPDEEDRVPIGKRPLLPPNQQQKVRTEASTGGTIREAGRRADRDRRNSRVRDV